MAIAHHVRGTKLATLKVRDITDSLLMRMNIDEDERSLIRYIRYNIRCHDLFVPTTYDINKI